MRIQRETYVVRERANYDQSWKTRFKCRTLNAAREWVRVEQAFNRLFIGATWRYTVWHTTVNSTVECIEEYNGQEAR